MLIRIASESNGRLRLVRKLQSARGRSDEGCFTVEGINLVSEVIDRGLDIAFIMVSEGWLGAEDDREHTDKRRSAVRECAESDKMTVCEVPEALFNRITDAEFGAGVLAVVRKHETDPCIIDELTEDSNILVLDRIQDPGNMGTMIRTAVAAGYSLILAAKGTVDIYSPKVLRATAGMVFEIPVIYTSDMAEMADMLSRSGRKAVVTVPEGGRPYYEEDLSGGIALIIGNEGRGVCDEMMDLAETRVTLPMKGNIESLNAAIAAAILMYEAVRK